jgi:hypothetical protein
MSGPLAGPDISEARDQGFALADGGCICRNSQSDHKYVNDLLLPSPDCDTRHTSCIAGAGYKQGSETRGLKRCCAKWPHKHRSHPSPACAHKPSDSYLSLVLENGHIAGQWDIALRDLDYAIGIDTDNDGVITWGELALIIRQSPPTPYRS